MRSGCLPDERGSIPLRGVCSGSSKVERPSEEREVAVQVRPGALSGSSSKVGDSTRTGDTVGSIPTALTSIPEAQSDERPFPKRKGVGSIPTGGAGANAVRTTSHDKPGVPGSSPGPSI